MSTIILCPNPTRDPDLTVTNHVARLIANAGGTARVFPIFDPEEPEEREDALGDALRDASLIIAFGGDGTMLRAARASIGSGVPLVGVNMGGKGFLAELELADLDRIPAVAAGEFEREARLCLDIELVRGGAVICRDFAVNDVVVGGVAKVIDLTLYGDGRRIARMAGDGVVVATPTGSTAYSLSAGGPIVEPSARNILITPVCAHSLEARPYVLSAERRVTVEIGAAKRNPAYMAVDGRELTEVLPGDRLEVCAARASVCFAHISDRSFYKRVSEKLGETM
jgi:NAD+ kinase